MMTPSEGRLELAKHLRDGFNFKLYTKLLKSYNATSLIFTLSEQEKTLELSSIVIDNKNNIMYIIATESFIKVPISSKLDNFKLAFDSLYYETLLMVGNYKAAYNSIPADYENSLYLSGNVIATFTEIDSLFPVVFTDGINFEVAPL
jgi:hypothetical protein